MGSADMPPPHVPSHVVPVSNALLQAGGFLWTLCYVLLARASLSTRSYGMPLFALALNFAWEVVYALYVAEEALEKTAFAVWLAIDTGLVYALLRHGAHEWAHAPAVQRNLAAIFAAMAAASVVGHWSFAKWWIDNDVGRHRGKMYDGRVGPDTTELGFWSAVVCQSHLSIVSLSQLVVRRHSGGVSWGVWATRSLGTLFGLYGYYGWRWWFWPEGHDYFVTPFAVFLCGTGLIADLAYPFVLASVRKTERVLEDGRKIPGNARAMETGYVVTETTVDDKKVS